MSLRSDCSRASVGGQCPITARPSHVLVGTRRIEEGVRGSGDRLWAISHNWTLMTANGLAANQRRLTPKGRATPRPNRCGGGAAHVRAWRGQYEPRGCPRGGRIWCFAGLPLGDLRRKADPGRLAVALLAAVQGGTLLRSCAAAHLTLKRCWTRSLIESRTSGPGELNSASRGVPSSRRSPGRHSA